MGRPRQPHCPDCLKQGKKVPKEGNYGYCADCRKLRASAYRDHDAGAEEGALVAHLKAEADRHKKRIEELESLVETLMTGEVRFAVAKARAEVRNQELKPLQKKAWALQERLHAEFPVEFDHPMMGIGAKESERS